jgi:hypothetical protein
MAIYLKVCKDCGEAIAVKDRSVNLCKDCNSKPKRSDLIKFKKERKEWA